MHLKRWITGIVTAPILLYLIYKGGVLFAGFVAVVVLICLWEFFRIVLKPSNERVFGIFPILGYLTGVLMVGAAYRYSTGMAIVVLTFGFLLLTLIMLISSEEARPGNLDLISKQLLGMVYIPLHLSFLVLIRNGQDGMIWVIFLAVIIFAGDTGAFYMGKYIGRHKLHPSVSPGKTVEGSLGGLLANVLAGSLIKVFFLPGLGWGPSLVFFVVAGAAGQVGDLFESGLKRMAGVKDSGHILPGHGGVLDRIDALLFAAPVAYLFKVYAQFGL